MHGPIFAMICQALRLSGVVILLQEKPLYCKEQPEILRKPNSGTSQHQQKNICTTECHFYFDTTTAQLLHCRKLHWLRILPMVLGYFLLSAKSCSGQCLARDGRRITWMRIWQERDCSTRTTSHSRTLRSQFGEAGWAVATQVPPGS